MKTLLRWLGLVFTLIVARVLIALAILGGVLFVIGAGLQSAGLPIPTQQEIAQRLQPALQDLGPVWQRLHAAVAPTADANFAPASTPAAVQSRP